MNAAAEGPAPHISVAVVDDQALVRGGFSMILEAEPDIDVVAEAGDGVEAVRVCAEHRPDVVLMDVRMPVMDGLEATRRIVAAGPSRVLMLTTFDLDGYVYDALRAGASGFLLKDVPPSGLASAVRTVAAGETLLAPTLTRRLVEEYVRRPRMATADPRLGRLTEREREVLTLIGRGLSNAEIARRLQLADATAKTHVSRILTKLELRDRVQAVVLAYESGLVQPGTDSL
jgi:DNA-binding NarL/FixJ family response regulator